jgi:hypothetical protein
MSTTDMFKIEYQLHAEDIRTAFAHSSSLLRYKVRKNRTLTYVGFFVITLPLLIAIGSAIHLWEFHSDDVGSELTWLGLSLLMAAVGFVVAGRMSSAYLIKVVVNGQGPYPLRGSLEFDEQEVRGTTDLETSTYSWSFIDRIDLADRHVLIMLKNMSTIVIPRAAFEAPEQVTEIMQYFEQPRPTT